MYYIGVDAGATKTHAILSDGEEIIAQDIQGPANHRVVGWETATKNILLSIKNVIETVFASDEDLHIFVGMAGVNYDSEKLEAQKKLRPYLKKYSVRTLHIVNDTLIALRSGTQAKNATVLICGTGSNCYAHNEQGEEVWIDGLDYILSDEASGYAIGLKGLHAATKSMDRRIKKTLIEKLICEKLEVHSMQQAEKIIYSENWSKKEIAACAYCVFDAAEEGDEAAQHIITEAVHEAILMLETAMRRLRVRHSECVCVGGLFTEKLFKKEFEHQVHTKQVNVHLSYPTHPPAWGAILLAQEIRI